MRMTRSASSRRPGITLVEMMVVAATSIFIVYLITYCFQQGLASFSNTRGQSDLMDQQRMAMTVMRRDLTADHFLPEDSKPNATRVSGQRLDQLVVSAGKVFYYQPPRGGYFVAQSNPVGNGFNFYEGTAADGYDSSRSTDHSVAFTVLLPGGSMQNMFSAEVPFGWGYQQYGRAAEVAYFLVPRTGSGATTPGGYPLYNLIRRQRLAAVSNDDAPAYSASLNTPPPPYPMATYADAAEVMALDPSRQSPGALRVLNLRDLTVPGNRLGGHQSIPFASLGINSSRYGEDVLLSNVLSFEIKFTGPTANGVFWPAYPSVNVWPRPANVGNTDAPYDNLPFDGRWDTFTSVPTNWSNAANVAQDAATRFAPMKKIRITGAMIRLRTYHPSTRQTRQTTLIVDL